MRETDSKASSLQQELLDGVSRTFALTIQALPRKLETVVGNAYLLCRIADTIEDASVLDADGVEEYSERFIRVVAGKDDPAAFAHDFLPLLREDAHSDERHLIRETTVVIGIAHRFDESDRDAILQCVTVMSRGMAHFQRCENIGGLCDLGEHAQYCYVVAGCVGEMLTRLFIGYLPQLQERDDELLHLSVSFGQALQMTNILKDFWEDRQRGACWLPRDIFQAYGLDLAEAMPGDPRFQKGLQELIGIAHGHAQRALNYTLALPRSQPGLRNFCLWALYMALLTLRKLTANPSYASGQEVKISRRSVRGTVLWCRLAARENSLIRAGFALLAKGLPAVPESLKTDPPLNREDKDRGMR